jgi:hypothetical protein
MENDPDYVDRVIRHRCGDAIADLVVPVELFVRVLEIIDALNERLQSLQTVVDDQTEAERHEDSQAA